MLAPFGENQGVTFAAFLVQINEAFFKPSAACFLQEIEKFLRFLSHQASFSACRGAKKYMGEKERDCEKPLYSNRLSSYIIGYFFV
ncbi:hypothetical protein [Enterococcus casseliflavus]|uniref:hypothetical protein n=1 Tax=Enterococcus casseliflavus TaxID=37734 RepID=UPI003D12587C